MWGDFNSGGKQSDDDDRLLRQELKKRRIMAEGLAASKCRQSWGRKQTTGQLLPATFEAKG